MTTLIVCSHGTRSLPGRAVVAAIIDQVRAALPGVTVLQAFVDVEEPAVADVVASVTGPVVVVPLLLSRGFHTNVDIARAVAGRADAVATAPLGPHPLLAEVLASRLAEAIAPTAAGSLVLAAAGSSSPDAVEDVEAVAALLRTVLDGSAGAAVTVGYAAGATPRIADAVAAAGAGPVVALSYVLAPGYFADVVASAGADLTTAPLGADPRIAQIVVERYRAALHDDH